LTPDPLPLTVIDAPSNLGLRPTGVERLPSALRATGLLARLGARDGGRVAPSASYDPVRDRATGLLNGPAIHDLSNALARVVAAVVDAGRVPLVLAGDCSIILGGLLGLRQASRRDRGSIRPGLMFVDGHVDFYQPDASPTGEVADMDLALATGRGPEVLSGLDPNSALVRDEDVAAVGARDFDERTAAGSQDVAVTGIRLFELTSIRQRGIDAVARDATAIVARPELVPGFWLHLDADVLDDAIMPAVDYRQPGGLTTAEVGALLRAAGSSGRMAGLSVAIYNPALDPTGNAGRHLADCIVSGLLEQP
jgi:arginase